MAGLLDKHLIYVTGKGGVGKTTVSAALGLAAAAAGRRTIVCEVAQQAPVRLMARSSAFQYLVAAAPGAREMITIAKVFELAQLERWDRHHRTYDLVIVDAPASGHGLAMLSTP